MDLTGKWTYNVYEDDIWGVYDNFDTKEEAIKEGTSVFQNNCVFYVGQLEPVELPTPDIISFLENLENDYNYDANSEEPLYLFDNISEDNKIWLQDKLNSITQEFYEKEKIKSNYYHVKNIQKIYTKEI